MPLPITTRYWARDILSSSPSFTTSFFTRWVMDQNSNRMVSALKMADIALTHLATAITLPPANLLAKLAARIKIGLPGGWPISVLKPWAINSGQSQKLAVGSMVSR